MAAGESDPSPEEIEASVDAAIAACDGNPRATVRALLLVNAYLEAELDRLGELISPGYARGRIRSER
jgi:hypothetical protein